MDGTMILVLLGAVFVLKASGGKFGRALILSVALVGGAAWLSNSRPVSQDDTPSSLAAELAVAEYLKPILSDPESLKIYSVTKPVRTGDRWSVTAEYSAKNKFGGTVKEREFFFLDGQTVVSTSAGRDL